MSIPCPDEVHQTRDCQDADDRKGEVEIRFSQRHDEVVGLWMMENVARRRNISF
jgi:hypothetical protein